ncbi:MAG TPA: hypothetical protein VJ824_10070 [Bacillota bacterium]|nr:hypothetical protein [Bacillota bacterium]
MRRSGIGIYIAFVFIALGLLFTLFALKISSSFDSGDQESVTFLFYLSLFVISGAFAGWVYLFIFKAYKNKKM